MVEADLTMKRAAERKQMLVGLILLPLITFLFQNVASIFLYRSAQFVAGQALYGASSLFSNLISVGGYLSALATLLIPLAFKNGVTYGQMWQRFWGQRAIGLFALGAAPVVLNRSYSFLFGESHNFSQTFIQRPDFILGLLISLFTELIFGLIIVMAASMSNAKDRFGYLSIRYAMIVTFGFVGSLIVRSQYSANYALLDGLLPLLTTGLVVLALSYYGKGRNTLVVGYLVALVFDQLLGPILGFSVWPENALLVNSVISLAFAALLTGIAFFQQNRQRGLEIQSVS